MVGPLQGRVAVVTGGSRGIGAAVAVRLATDGATVAVTHPVSDGPEQVLAAIRVDGHTCSAVEADNSDPAAV
jgi:3-oxoacyl-[acyl-carrier protein] reductase